MRPTAPARGLEQLHDPFGIEGKKQRRSSGLRLANQGGAVESASWWVEEHEEKGDPEVDRDRVAAARRKDGTALLDFRVAPFIYAGRLG